MKKIDIKLLAGNMLVESETKYQDGDLGGILLPKRLGSQPIEVAIVLDIVPDARACIMLGDLEASDLVGKRVYFSGLGGRRLPDDSNRYIYPITVCINPQKPERQRKYRLAIEGILDDSTEVNELVSSDPRCRFCGDAKPGAKRGRAIMLQDRMIDGIIRKCCPRCFRDTEGVCHTP